MKFKFKKRPYLIAEIGVNHENSITLAEKIIKQASEGGASAAKFQSYKAETIASKNSPAYWDTTKINVHSQYKLFKKFDKFNRDKYEKLKKICDHYKIDFMSTPFDNESVEYLSKLVKYFKVASADITNYQLIDKICKCNKPIIFSTGASNENEIIDTYNFITRRNKKIDISILHCILSYPTKYSDANLGYINSLKKKFPKAVIGLSDHAMPDPGMYLLTRAYEFGAMIIEKHFTAEHLKGKKNNDHFHSISKNDLKIFFKNINIQDKIIGKMAKRKVLLCEKKSRQFARRGLYTLKALKKGEVLSDKNLIPKRPSSSIDPRRIFELYGKTIKKDLPEDYKLKLSDIN